MSLSRSRAGRGRAVAIEPATEPATGHICAAEQEYAAGNFAEIWLRKLTP